jgi:alanine racemase
MMDGVSSYTKSLILNDQGELSGFSCQRAWVEIDLEALASNVKEIKQLLSSQTRLMAVVKADAYGHGAVGVANTILSAGADALAIATLGEGVELRQAGVNAPILLLGAVNSPEEVKAIAFWNLEPTICSPEQAKIISATLTQLNQTLKVHLKLDTGMSRLGTSWEKAREFVALVENLPHLQLVSVYSHLATADDPDPSFMKLQQQRFEEAIASLPKNHYAHHLANSAGTLSDPSLHYDLVRVGLALYGLYPAVHLSNKLPLKPVLSVKARITQIKSIPKGTGVSYSHKFVAPAPLNLAVVGIGYADGIPRNLSNRLQVLVRGQLVPQIGNITMDQLMIDVTNISNLQVGEIVTLIGQDNHIKITADDWANTLDTISWEILCSFKHRLPRVIINS